MDNKEFAKQLEKRTREFAVRIIRKVGIRRMWRVAWNFYFRCKQIDSNAGNCISISKTLVTLHFRHFRHFRVFVS